MTTPDRPGVVNCLATVTELKFLAPQPIPSRLPAQPRRLGATPLSMKIAADMASLGEPVERRLGSREETCWVIGESQSRVVAFALMNDCDFMPNLPGDTTLHL